jgi:rRNA processing protein Krr1/Pno1
MAECFFCGVRNSHFVSVLRCSLSFSGNTVSAMGSIHGLKAVRKIVLECMQNVHPIYNIKILMIKKELAADPALKEENWDRFLPSFKKKNVQRKKVNKAELAASVAAKEANFTPFPPAPTPRKLDLALESGEYFLSAAEKAHRAQEEKIAKAEEKAQGKRQAREQLFTAPTEDGADAAAEEESSKKKKEKKNKKHARDSDDADGGDAPMADAEEAAEQPKAKKAKKSKREDAEAGSSAAAAASSPAAPASAAAAAAGAFNPNAKPAVKRKRGEAQATVPEHERRAAQEATAAASSAAVSANGGGGGGGVDVAKLKSKFKAAHQAAKIAQGNQDATAFVVGMGEGKPSKKHKA